MDRIQEQKESFDIFLFYQEFTLDSIASIALGVTDNLQGNSSYNQTLETVRTFFESPPAPMAKLLFMLSVVFPETHRFCRWVGDKAVHFPGTPIMTEVEKVVEKRKRDQAEGTESAVTDYIQLFMEAEASDDYKKEKMSVEEVVTQCFVFLLAGYDTTSNTLAYATYLVMTDQRVQQKLYDEVVAECGNGEITFEALLRMKYLEIVIKETLRLYPLASIAVSRECTSDCTLGVGHNKIKIEKGTFVQADVWTIHYNKDVWGKDAHLFRPERWEDSMNTHPMAWLPFGAGPRTCLGMKLAMMETKLTLATLMMKYTIQATDDTQIPLKYHGTKSICPENVFCKLVPRL